MAWALGFNGVDQLLSIANITPPSIYRLEFDVLIDADSPDTSTLFSNSGSNRPKLDMLKSSLAPDIKSTFFGLKTNTSISAPYSRGERFTFITENNGVNESLTTQYGTYATLEEGKNYRFNRFMAGRYGGRETKGLLFGVRFYDNGVLINDWSPDASDHSNTGQQPILVDTVGSNDATGVNFATDGSAWIDLGGAAGEEQDLTLVNAAQSSSATLLTASQAFVGQSINAEQLTTASLLSITSAGSQTVVIVNAAQVTDATTVSVDQAFDTVATSAEQSTTASVILIPDQDAFTLVNAAQTTSSDIIEASQAFITVAALSEQNTIASISFIPDDVTVINVTSFNLKQLRYRMKVK